MTENLFRTEFEVRDYEIDRVGIVNNSVYNNYLEHARHKYLESIGFSFTGLAEAGIKLVLTRLEIEYKKALLAGDVFYVTTRMSRESPLRFAFFQEIYRNDELVVRAVAHGTSLGADNRPTRLPKDIVERIS